MTLISPRMARSRLSVCVMLCPECISTGKTEQASGLHKKGSADFKGCSCM